MAVIGTLTALILTGLLGMIVTSAAHLSGFGTEEAAILATSLPGVDLRGLLVAGIIIGSLGVLDDVTVTQSATVAELALANPLWLPAALPAPATRIGRAHIASTINTIILAYAGASLPLLLLFAVGARSAKLLTSEVDRPGNRPQRRRHDRADRRRADHDSAGRAGHRPGAPVVVPAEA